MAIFRGDYEPMVEDGLRTLSCVKDLIYCIGQEESSARELDAYTLLGLSGILGNAGYVIEQASDKMYDNLEADQKRHRKLRAALSKLKETERTIGKSDIERILEDDEREVAR